MSKPELESGTPVWLGEAGEPQPFADGNLWIGEHADDHDILVFDPAESDPNADLLALYSLKQHRTRRFPRATVLERIHPLTDELSSARARKEYEARAGRRAKHEQALDDERAARRDRERDGVLAAHRRFVESLGLEYGGVRDTADGGRTRRRTKCHTCGIALDDFAGSACTLCDGVLCSCGACACQSAVRAAD